MNIVQCDRKGCDVSYEKKTHNQRYCSTECCRLATNARIMEKYYERKEMRSGKERFCIQCHNSKLSRYNPSDTCAACQAKNVESANNSALSMLNSILVV